MNKKDTYAFKVFPENKKVTYPLNRYDFRQATYEQYENVRAEMKQRYKQTEMRRQLQIFQDRKKWKDEDPLSNWFLQSGDRLAIFHLFNLDGFPDGLTVNMVSRIVGLPRTTTSRLLMACYKKRFIYKNPEQGKSRFYLPSDHLLTNGDYWCEYFIDGILNVEGEPDRSMFYAFKRAEHQTRIFDKLNVTP